MSTDLFSQVLMTNAGRRIAGQELGASLRVSVMTAGGLIATLPGFGGRRAG